MASERYSFSLTTFSPRYLEMSNTFLWKGGIYFESVEIKTQYPQEPHPLNPQNCAPYLSNCGELVQIECSAKNMKLVCHDHACILAFGSSRYEIVFLLLKSKHNCPLLIFLVIALMMKFCKSLRRQLRDEFPMTASFPSDKSTLDRRKKL